MIPTLPQISAGLAAGTYSPQQASGWVALHITAAIAQGRTADLHAAVAVERHLIGGIRTRNTIASGFASAGATA